MNEGLSTIKLRELEHSDLSQLNQWRNTPEIIESLGNNFVYIAQVIDEQWYEHYLKNRHTQVRLAIIHSEPEIYIGNVNLTSIHPINRSAEFSIMIGDTNYWSKGIGHKATLKMLCHGFEDLNLNRIELKVLKDNQRAIRLYEKCGFQQEGYQRAAIFKNGNYQDVILMALLREDWYASGVAQYQ